VLDLPVRWPSELLGHFFLALLIGDSRLDFRWQIVPAVQISPVQEDRLDRFADRSFQPVKAVQCRV